MRLTAEFEMGSGSGHTAQTTRPAQHIGVFGKRTDSRSVGCSAGEAARALCLFFDRLLTGSRLQRLPTSVAPPAMRLPDHITDMDHGSDQVRSSD